MKRAPVHRLIDVDDRLLHAWPLPMPPDDGDKEEKGRPGSWVAWQRAARHWRKPAYGAWPCMRAPVASWPGALGHSATWRVKFLVKFRV